MADTPPTVTHPTRDPKDVEDNKDLAALSYAWIMSVVLLIAKRHSPFVHFHAKQGTVLFLLSIVFFFIPVANRILILFVFFLSLWGFLAAAQGQWAELPFVGPLARGKFSLRGSWKQTIDAIVSMKHWVMDLWTRHDEKKPENGAPKTEVQAPTSTSPAPPMPVAPQTAHTSPAPRVPETKDIPPVDP